MGKKSGYSVISASSVEYDAEDGTSLQRRTDHAHQHAPYADASSEFEGSSASSIYNSKHARTEGDIPMAELIPKSGIQDDIHEPPGYHETTILSSHQGTGHEHLPTDPFRDPEEPKMALLRSFKLWKNLCANMVHFLALSTTIPVLWLNFSSVYWADEDNWQKKPYLFNLNQQDTFNALQFAAKIHEIFVAASVSAMTMHVVRRKLIGTRGLPFGLVVGAYQIGSAEYLKSKNFRAPLSKSILRAQWDVLFIALLIGISVIYVNMIGPASAALLIPTLDWYPVKDPFGGLPLTTYFWPLNRNISTDYSLYPQSFDISDTPFLNCTNATFDRYELCPGTGYDQLDNWCLSWALSGLQYDPLMDVLLGKMKRQVVSRMSDYDGMYPGITVASTLHNQIALVLDLFSQYVDMNRIGEIKNIKRPRYSVSDATPIYSPLVQVQCAGEEQRTWLELLDRGWNMSFSTYKMSNFSKDRNVYKSEYWKVPTELWSAADASTNDVTFTWIPASEIRGLHGDGGPIDASIAALARVPVVVGVTQPNGTKQMQQESLVVSCMFDARWAATAVSYDPKQNSTADFNLTDPVKMLGLDILNYTDLFSDKDAMIASDFGVSGTVVIDTSWADLLNVPKVIDNGISGATIPAIPILLSSFIKTLTDEDNRDYENFIPIRPDWTDSNTFYTNVTNTIEILLSTLVADGMARANDIGFLLYLELTQDQGNGTVTVDDILTQAGNWEGSPLNARVSAFKDLERIEFNVERYGWGYGLNSPTAKFAVAILLAYVVMFFLFQIMCLIFLTNQRGWTSRAWEDIGELVALAAMSRESEALQNTGAGIDKGETWMTPVRIRERQSQRVEIIFGDIKRDSTEAYGLLKVGKKYY